jgi:hypothetical protein
MHSSSSLYINYISPINNININSNNKNKSKKESLVNESIKNNNMILTSVDNSSSLIGSKEKILSYNQNYIQNQKDIQYYHKKMKV